MKIQILLCVTFLVSLILTTMPLNAATTGGVYDMSRLIQEPHPFAKIPVKPGIQLKRPIVRQTISKSSKNKSIKVLPVENPENKKSKSPKLVSKSQTDYNNGKRSGRISEVRGGFLVHDEGPFSRNKEDGVDANFEVLFKAPQALDIIFSPRPHVGVTMNSAGNTSQLYAGVTWDWAFFQDYFINFSLGGAVHTGEKVTDDLKKKSLGCRTLFRESLDLGYNISGPHSIMFHFDHISNAKLCSTNEGLENFGLRYGYRF